MLYPIYKSTFERGDGLKDATPNMTASYRDHMIMWAKDVGRSVDYLESRPDIAKDKIGFLGYSWGAELAPLLLAVEPRISLGLICLGAFSLQPSLPEADPVNFAPRVKVPVLMLNGRFDFFGPTATSQEPLFKLLGTPANTNAVSSTRRHTDSAQRDDQGSGRLDGEVQARSTPRVSTESQYS